MMLMKKWMRIQESVYKKIIEKMYPNKRIKMLELNLLTNLKNILGLEIKIKNEFMYICFIIWFFVLIYFIFFV